MGNVINRSGEKISWGVFIWALMNSMFLAVFNSLFLSLIWFFLIIGIYVLLKDTSIPGWVYAVAGISMLFMAPFLMLFTVFSSYASFFALGFLVGINGIFLILKANSAQIHSVGRKGEEEVIRNLETLDDNYYIINRFLLKGKSDIDHIVVGPKGVYVIETKNLKGEVIFSNNGFDIEHVKVDQWGIRHTKRPRNPIKQVHWNCGQLKKILMEKKKAVDPRLNIPYINGVCVFTDEAMVTTYGAVKYPILKTDELTRYLKSRRDVLSTNEIYGIVNLILA